MTSPGPAPTRRGLLGAWLLAAVALGVLLLIAQLLRGPLDDPDQAYQRPGILDLTALPQPAPPVTPEIPRAGRPAVVFFERPEKLAALCESLPATGLAKYADLVIVTPAASGSCGPLTVIADPGGNLAGSYGIRPPAAGGPPVGYAIVDADQQIRYRTLDPTVASELSEVRTILGAL